MAIIEFTGRDVVAWFREHPSNGQEWQYRVRYECANQSVTHFINHTEYQSIDADEMRVYKDALTFEENVAAGLTRSPKVYLATQVAGGKWSDERLIESNNPAPPVPPMSYMNGYDMVTFSFDKPEDTDWAGFVVWADTQQPVRKDQITSKYEGPNNVVQLSLVPDTTYYITYAAYDAFGTDALNEATIQIHTLSKESVLLPVLNERLEAIEALTFKSSSALTKLTNAYSVEQDRKLARAEERLGIRIDENGGLVAERVLTLETQFGDFQSLFQQHQQTQAGENEALSQSITLMGARVGANETAIVEERTARVTADSALSLRLDQQASRIDDNEAQFADQIQTLVDEDGALALRITNQAAQWQSDINGAVTAATNTINENIANGDLALSQRIDTLSAQVGEDGWTAALETERTVRADADEALTQLINTASAGLDDKIVTIEQSMTAQGNEIDGLSAQYTLRIDNNGRISGFGLASDPNGNSEFAVNADRFLVAHPGGAVPVFEVVGGQVRMAQAIIDRLQVNGAQIKDLSVDTIKIAGGAITANQVAAGGDTYVRAGGSADFLTTGFMTIGDGVFGSGIINVSFTIDATLQYDAACRVQLWVDTGSGFTLNREQTLGISTDDGDTYSRTAGIITTVVSGSQVRVRCRCLSGTYTPRSVARNMYVRDITMTLMGAKR